MKIDFLYGIELECNINRELPITVGSYHAGHILTEYWETQSDASVRTDYSRFRGAELVSFPFTRKQLPEVMQSLKSKIDSTDTMNNIIFNDSCGAHLHFSMQYTTDNTPTANRSLQFKIPYSFLKIIKNRCHTRVSKAYPHIYSKFASQYDRRYAKVYRNNRQNYRGTRNCEFNHTRDKGVEWRSFNVLGVEKWSELQGMIEIGISSIEDTLYYELTKPKAFLIKKKSWENKAVEKMELPEIEHTIKETIYKQEIASSIDGVILTLDNLLQKSRLKVLEEMNNEIRELVI